MIEGSDTQTEASSTKSRKKFSLHRRKPAAHLSVCVVPDPLHRIVCCCHIESPSASEHLIDFQTQQRTELEHVFVLANPEAQADLMTDEGDLSSCVEQKVLY